MDPTSIYWIVLNVIDILAISFNSLLIYLALFQTPKILRTYTTLIINLAITDCFSAAFNFFVQQRMIPAGFTIGYVSNGFCRHFGPQVCFLSHNIMAHFIVHSNYSLLLSFAYRYYILVKQEPKRRNVLIVVVIIYIPSFIQLILYQFAESDPSEVIKLLLSHYPTYSFDNLTVTGVADIRNIFALFKILQMTVMTVPQFLLIIYFRKKIISKLIYRGINISISTKSLHSQLLIALTYQAIIPTLYSISVVMYILEQSGIYTSPAFENYIMSGLVLIPFFSPFASFIFFTPYKRFLLGLFSDKYRQKKSNVSISGAGSGVAQSARKI